METHGATTARSKKKKECKKGKEENQIMNKIPETNSRVKEDVEK